MKKLLLFLSLNLLTLVLFSQPCDTSILFQENFDGPTHGMTVSSNFGTDWTVINTLSVSPSNCIHTPVHATEGLSYIQTPGIALDPNKPFIYLDFDHICKVHNLDASYIYYSVSTGINPITGELMYSSWSALNFTQSSPFYYGDATSVIGGKFMQDSYSTWLPSNNTANPTNAWWKHEKLEISNFVSNGTNTHFRLQFRNNKTSPSGSGTQNCAGWYVDNVAIVASLTELISPAITLQPTVYVNNNNNVRNFLGPYIINARIIDNDTVNVNATSFYYTINGGPQIPIDNTITSNTYTGGNHVVNYQWTISDHICYGDLVRYHIYSIDSHCSEMVLDTSFTPWSNATNLGQNDCDMGVFYDFPFSLIIGQPFPIKVDFINRSMNNMTSLQLGWRVNDTYGGQQTGSAPWTGDLCMDEGDTLTLGNFTPVRGYNYIKAFVTTRNNTVDDRHANDTITLTAYACDSIMNGHYTMGGANADFPSFNAVMERMINCGINGPVEIEINPGTYPSFFIDQNVFGQNEMNYIKFYALAPNTVTILDTIPASGTNQFAPITLSNVSNYRFHNLTLQGRQGDTYSHGVSIYGNGCSNIEIVNCTINLPYTTTTTSTSFSGICRLTAANTTPDLNILISNCTIIGGDYGITYTGSTARKNVVEIENCDITTSHRGINTYYTNATISNCNIVQRLLGESASYQEFTGLYIDRCEGPVIEGNTIVAQNGAYGIYLNYGTAPYVAANRINVKNSSYGLYLNNSSGNANNYGFIINNEIISSSIAANNSFGVEILTSTFLKIKHNSVLISSEIPLELTATLHIQNNNVNYVDNNILVNLCLSSSNVNYPIYLVGNTSFSGDYNDYYSVGGVIGFKTVARTTLADWQTAVSSDAHAINYLVPFTDSLQSLLPTSYDIITCPTSSDVTEDIRGYSRPGEITYMGCYSEPVSPINAGLISLVSPASGTQCPLASYPITVRVSNNGSSSLNFNSNNATINVVATGGITLNTNYTLSSGSVAPLEFIDVTVVPSVAIPFNQPINFVFTISLNGDTITSDNVLQQSFTLEIVRPNFEEVFSSSPVLQWRFEQIAGAGNWTFQQGEGINPVIAPVYGTGRLFFNSKSFSNTTEARAIMPVVMLDSAVNPILEMWFAHDNGYTASTYNLEGVTVKISTDGGNTYTNLIAQGQTQALIKRANTAFTTPGWQLYTFDLSNYVNNGCVFIAFDARSRAGNNINIDRIRIRNLWTNDLSVSNIYSYSENPSVYRLGDVVSALVRNEGSATQSNKQLYLHVSGANNYSDTITIPSLTSNSQAVYSFPDFILPNNGLNDMSVTIQNDQYNSNNTFHFPMLSTSNEVNVADSSDIVLTTGSMTEVIRPVVRYKVDEPLMVTGVKFFYQPNYIDNPSSGFIAFVSDQDGNIRAISDTIYFNQLTNNIGSWLEIPINNYALTNVNDYFYVGIQMLGFGYYMPVQYEAPIRDNVFFLLEDNGTYSPQTLGKFMLGAIVDTPITNEMAILSLVHPLSNCDLGHENITIEITNNGSEIIPAGSVFHYSVNNLPIVTNTLNEAVQVHETRLFEFDTFFNFTNNIIDVDSNYNIKVWVDEIAGDRVRFNDTLDVDITSVGKSAMPVVTDTVIVNYHTNTTLSATLPATIPQGVFTWYTNTGFEEWDYHGQGNTFTTPTIYFDTTYYVNVAPGQVFDITVGTGTVFGAQPFMFTSGYSRGRVLYTQSEIGQYGPITRIGLNVHAAATGANGIPIKIYIKQTDLNTFPTNSPFNWNNELVGAQLVVDDQIFFSSTGWYYFDLPVPFDYTSGNIVILTESNCGGNNCGANVSGSTVYPSFKGTTVAQGFVQYRNGNTETLTGNYSNYTRKWNMKFNISDLNCPSEKIPIYIHVPDMPNYDVETVQLLYPETACTLGEENIQVSVLNRLNIAIPANLITVYATFNGTTITHIIDEPFAPNELKTVTFTTPFNFGAPTANITFNYNIRTDFPTEQIVYRGNDTITGSFISKHTDVVPEVINYTGNYTQTFTVDPDNTHNVYYFYADSTSTTPFYTGASYTTAALYDTLTMWVSAKTNTANNCETERMRININVFTPAHDLITNSFNSPISYQCGVMNPHIEVNVANTDTSAAGVIPAGTFKIKANFTGTGTANGEHVINQPISAQEDEDITFGNTITLGSTTINHSYNYSIYTDPVDPTMGVYRLNDTITGQLFVPANPVAPTPITVTVPYGLPYTVTPNSSILDYFYFYESSTGANHLAQGNSFTTEPVFDSPTTYYYSGRIDQTTFTANPIIGTGNSTTALPFTFTSGHSVGAILYTAAELNNGNIGRIDTISIFVNTPSYGDIPVKFYLKNDTRVALPSGTYTWSDFTTGAQLIFDGETNFNEAGWYDIPIIGGFDYTGESLLLLTEHDCGNASCVTSLGVTPTPLFKYTATTPTYKTISRSGNTPITSGSFTGTYFRINTKFKISYTCESPRALITLNTTVPARDLAITEIINPITPDTYGNESVSVRITNYGTTTASSFQVGYIFDNNAAVMQNYTGSITSGNTVTFNFTTPVNMSDVYFSTPFKVFVSYTNDAFASNDTLYLDLRRPDPCVSRSTNVVGADITNLTFAGINNGTGTPTFNYTYEPGNSFYTDYTSSVAPAFVVQGQPYPVSITNSFTAASGTALYKYVYIDFNRDNQFDNTGVERAYFSSLVPAPTAANPANATTLGELTVPVNAEVGLTRMRVITSQTQISSNTPCNTYSNGETEDYAVYVSPPFEIDLAVSGYFHPVGSVCADDNGKIKVYIKNYGATTQTFSTSNALIVTAVVTGPVNGTYTTTVSNGSIPPFEVMTVEIQNVDYSLVGTYNISTTLTYLPDQYNINDVGNISFTIDDNSIAAIPFFENFESGIVDESFPSFWTISQTSSNFQWSINAGYTENFPNAGPGFDHTSGTQFGKYAVVEAPNSVGRTAVANLTSNCLDLHYNDDGYPKEIMFYKHFFGSNTAEIKMYVQVGSGENYITVDSITNRVQVTCDDLWRQHFSAFTPINENARVRFKVTGHYGLFDPAIDDITFKEGVPDMCIDSIVSPVDFRTENPDCLRKGDTIYPIVIVKNCGRVPVRSFNIIGTMSVGNYSLTHVEPFNGNLASNQFFQYQFINPFIVPEDGWHCQFQARTEIENDENTLNDVKTIISCTEVGIEDYEITNGVMLGQNIPNPAYNVTKIPFIVPESGRAVVKVHSVTGQLLYTEERQVDFGDYYVELNVSQFADGIYFYTLQFGDVVLTKKMVVQK